MFGCGRLEIIENVERISKTENIHCCDKKSQEFELLDNGETLQKE